MRTLSLALLVAIGCSFEAEQKLLPSVGAREDRFGAAVAVEGRVALVGARGDDTLAQLAGAAHVFRHDGTRWVEEQKLLASDAARFDGFGGAVAIRGDVALVGAILAGRSGKVYVFRHDGISWVEEQQLTRADPDSFGWFGSEVALGEGVALVTDERRYDAAIFRYDGAAWVYEQLLEPSEPGIFGFGHAGALSGKVAVVTSDRMGSPEGDGSAWVFRYDGSAWLEEQKLLASDGSRLQGFGRSVAVDGDHILVGAKLARERAAYFYRYDGSRWVEEQKVTPLEEFSEFGQSVALSRGRALVGNASLFGLGGVHVYRLGAGGWLEERPLMTADSEPSDRFGSAVSLAGPLALVGAPGNRDFGFDSGSAYVFGRPEDGAGKKKKKKGTKKADTKKDTKKGKNSEGRKKAPPSPSPTPRPPIVTCSFDFQCDDDNPCTIDRCLDPGTPASRCANPSAEGQSCEFLGTPNFGTCMDGACFPLCCGFCGEQVCTVVHSCPGCFPGPECACGLETCPPGCISLSSSPGFRTCSCL